MAEFREVDFTGARIRSSNFANAKLTDVSFENVDIDGYIHHVTINGVDVTDYVNDELNRRDPERALLGVTDP